MTLHLESTDSEEEVEKISIKERFPAANEERMGGESDGYEYRTIFAGMSLKHSYEMVQAFLKEEGYTDIPLPKDAEELSLFRLKTRNKQILLFEDNGYVHNPIKILFPSNRRNKRTLILSIFNEADPDHLLKFHRKGDYEEGSLSKIEASED